MLKKKKNKNDKRFITTIILVTTFIILLTYSLNIVRNTNIIEYSLKYFSDTILNASSLITSNSTIKEKSERSKEIELIKGQNEVEKDLNENNKLKIDDNYRIDLSQRNIEHDK